MARSTAWIRNNMLFSEDEYDEQLTEARLKVQRSFQKLSISDWHSHKCSNPPPNLVKVTPFESRPPSWKNFKEKSTLYSMNLLGDKKLNEEIKAKVPPRTIINNENYYPKRLTGTKYKEYSNCASKDKTFDTNIPKVKLSKNIYGTYPKMSPSRKVQNINIVLPVRPKIEPLTNQINVNKKNDYSNNSRTPRESRQRNNDAIQISDIMTTPIRTPDMKSNFKIPATSTPKFSRAYLFSSNISEDTPKMKKTRSRNILEKSYIFENKSMNESDDYKLDNTFKCRKLSKNMLEKASIFDSSLRIENFDRDYKEDIRCYKETPVKTPKENSLLQRNIRSIDSILSKDDYDLTMPKSSSMVRDIAKKLEIANISSPTDESTLRTKMNSILQRKKSNRPNSVIHFIRSKYEKEKTIKEMMGNLTEKENKSSLSRQNYNTKVNQNAVKQLVNIDKEIESKVKIYHQSLKRNFVCEEDSFSESEAKSVVTSTSPKDTDSSSDTDQKSLYLNYEHDSFDNENSTTEKTLETEEKVFQDESDDDVYWIPVSNPYKFPRTSSLLTISSQISIDTPSPCISPIKMEEEVDIVQKHWRNTTRKINPFYRIDETIVIDSGYSDKSEAIMNNSESSITDSYYQ
ncbi:uncharacterized protein LOC122718758 [Apis laboriosa]|uniref:uncharacterized protein LOC122718758 n=1 Tax=Apis laboriosa TaxID=183418 RepID=UPI001CC743B4|nr:uncharacterized protein LOC122718758 [Apis laboriosa]